MSDTTGDPYFTTNEGQPDELATSIKNADVETVGLSTNREFIDLIEHSRARVRAEGGISSEEMRRRFDTK